MTEKNMSFLRHATIHSSNEGGVLADLAKVPGYRVEPIRVQFSERTHVLIAQSGDTLHIVNGADKAQASISNVNRQDEREGFLPIHEDELVILSNAADVVEGLSVSVAMSEDDRKNPKK